jgi:hypothetical protein
MLEQAKATYVKIHNDIDKARERIAFQERKIERLYNKGSWTEVLIRPIMELVKIKFPQIKWGDDRLVTMGLCSRVSIFGHIGDDKENYISIAFTPSNLNEGVISYDTGEMENNYPKGSIGNLNGFGLKSEEITDIEQIYNHIEKQLNSI